MDAGCRPKCAEVVGLGAQWATEIALDGLAKVDNLETRLTYSAKDDFMQFLKDHRKE